MYSIFAIIIGMIISIMISFNSQLEISTGTTYSLIIIHGVGLIACIILIMIKKERLKIDRKLSIFMYSGGIIGICLTLVNMATINSVGVALTTSFGVFGQMIFSSLIDHFGLFGMNQYKFDRRKLIGFIIVFLGLIIMTV